MLDASYLCSSKVSKQLRGILSRVFFFFDFHPSKRVVCTRLTEMLENYILHFQKLLWCLKTPSGSCFFFWKKKGTKLYIGKVIAKQDRTVRISDCKKDLGSIEVLIKWVLI